MSMPFNRLGLASLIIIAGAATLAAQTATTGAIAGVVTDPAGSPIAGATLTLSSGQIVRTVITGADGHYQAGLLNAGSWTVSVSRTGFLTGRQHVSVNINAATTANFKLGKEGAAFVEVVASASTIDTSSTTTGSNFSLDTITNMPTGRDIGDVAFMTPGVSYSGFNATDNLGLNISISGASGAENSFSVDGLKTTDMRYGGQGVSMIQDFVDQIEVQTGGFKPEYSSMGGVFNVTTKTGSNEFAASAWSTFSPAAMSPGPKKSQFYTETAGRSVSDIGAWAGGAMIKDKLFYSVGLNLQQTSIAGSTNAGGLPVGSNSTPNFQFFGKVNYFVNTDNQLTLSYFGNNSKSTQENGNTLGSVGDGWGNNQSGYTNTDNTNNFNVIWDSTLAPNMFLSVKVGQSNILNDYEPTSPLNEIIDSSYFKAPNAGAGFPGGAGYGLAPSGTHWYTGGGGAIDRETNKTTQYSVDFTWILGDHSLKMGYSDLKSQYIENDHNDGPDDSIWYLGTSGGQAYVGRRYYDNSSEANAEFQALYLQDTWQVSKGLNVFYGARAEHQMQKGNDGQTFMDFAFGKYIQPRLGFTWDVKADGTSKITGSFAQYYEQIPQRMAIRTYGNEGYYFYWFGAPQGGGAIPWSSSLPTAPWTGVGGQITTPGQTSYANNPAFGYMVNYSEGWSHDPIMDGVKLPQRIELQLGFDQQVSATTTLGIHGHYRKLTNPLEDSILANITNDPNTSGMPLDPHDKEWAAGYGAQAIIWNPHPGTTSWTDLEGYKVTVNNTGFPTAYNEYKAVDLSYTRKTSDSMLFLGYTWSRNYGNYEGVISPTNGQPDGNITASYDYAPYVGTGLMPTDHTHSFKAYGYKKLQAGPGNIVLGFNFLAQTGSPISLQDNGASTYGTFANGGTDAYSGSTSIGDPGGYGNATFAGGKMGNYGRTPTITKLDLTLHYQWDVAKKVVVEPLFEIYNVMNSRPVTTVFEQGTDATGAPEPAGKWGSPTTYQAPRSIRFGVKARF